jgi:holo-[acyl-carrier protein] synthase
VTTAKIHGVGIDAVSIERMDSDRMGAHVLNRMFHQTEVDQAMAMDQGRAQFLASRFAAKEALVKALGTGFRGISPSEIAVRVNSIGKPEIVLEAGILERLGFDSIVIHLSLTHEGPLAIAFVVVEDVDGAF